MRQIFILAMGLVVSFVARPVVADCPNLEPSTTSTFVWGAQVSCGETYCGQNYAVLFNYTCNIPSPGKKCDRANGIVSIVYEYKCPGGECDLVATEVLGPTLVSAGCD